jgi:hypothetical protein
MFSLRIRTTHGNTMSGTHETIGGAFDSLQFWIEHECETGGIWSRDVLGNETCVVLYNRRGLRNGAN